jgi:purine-binding chemotaxis protein CheW
MTDAGADRVPGEPLDRADGRQEFLVFDVAAQRFALPLPNVREVLRAVAITRLPDAPAVIEGVIDVRGSLVPVMDLRARVGLPRRPLELEDRLIVVESDGRTLALRVDRVHWTIEVEERALESTRTLAPEAAYIAGVARLEDGLVLIHDLRRFLSPSEAAELARALELHGGEGAGP